MSSAKPSAISMIQLREIQYLPRTGPTDCKASEPSSNQAFRGLTDTDTLSRLDMERDAMQHVRPIFGISGRQVLDPQVSARGPVCGRLSGLGDRFFVFDVDVALDPLQTGRR